MHAQIFIKYPPKDKSNLIAILQDVQDIYGYLPECVLTEVAEFIDMPLSRIYGVATFYNQFRLFPLGENIIRVCRGTACHVGNSAKILFALENELKTKSGNTTRDKKFTLETVACIGACSIAPVVVVNDDYHGKLAVKDVPTIVKKYSNAQKPTTPEKVGELS